MDIDWITVAAQIVNFLVLVWLLQRFLYRPITRAMDRREQRIADRLRQASETSREAEAEAERYREKQRELDERRERLLAEAREEAERERKSMQHAARQEVEQRKREWLKQLDEQQQSFLRDIRRHASEKFFELSRQALGELAGADLESLIAGVFVERLRQLDKGDRQKIANACRKGDGNVLVRSRFELSASDKRQITQAVHEEIRKGVEVVYELSQSVGCGVELEAGSRSLSWSLQSYFDSLERELSAELSGMAEQGSKEAAE